MPKSKDKKTKLKEPISGGKNTKNRNDSKKRKLPKAGSLTDGIEMSKQLARKVTSRKRATSSKPNNVELRICGNGKPMPSLAELEKMFEDSDDGDETTASMSLNHTERCKTPVNSIDTTHITGVSPKTLKKLTSTIIDVVTTINNSLHEPSPPIQQKKSKKSSPSSYRDYSQRVKEPNISFFKPESNCIVDKNDNSEVDEDDCPRKRRKISKSVFSINHDINLDNCNELEVGEVLSDGSTDSLKTVSYDYMNSSFDCSNQHRSFSPLPSTSKDNDTFLQNVKRFNDSLQYEKISTPETSDLEIIEIPCETIILDADKNLSNCLEVIEIDVEEQNDGGHSPIKVDSPLAIDDYYSSIDLNQNYDSEVCDTVDIDEVMAENKAIIEKYNNIGTINTVTKVKPSFICDKLTSELNMTPPDCNSTNKITVKKTFGATQDDISKTKGDNNSVEFVDHSLGSTNTQPSSKNKHKIEEIVAGFFGSQKGNNKDKQNCSGDELNDETCSAWNDTIKQWVSEIDQNVLVNTCKSKTTTNITVNGKQSDSKSDFNMNDIPIIDITSGYYTPTVQPVRQTNYNVIVLDPSLEQTRESVKQCNDAPFLVKPFISLAKRDDNMQIIDLDDDNTTSPIYRQCNNNSVEMIRNFSSLDHNYMTTGNTNDHINADVIRNASLDHNYLTVTTEINQRNKKSKRNTKTKTNIQITLEKSIENETPRSISDCPICMENMSNKEIASTMCGHLFCMKCIKAAIKASGKKCPTCRKALKGVGYHQIFL